jgi:hypothetical protein
MPTFGDDTSAGNLAATLRRIAVEGVPKQGAGRSAMRDDVSDGAAALANKALEMLRDTGSAGLGDWLVMRLANEPDDLFASMVQRRFAEALLAARLIVPASEMDTESLWTETGAQAPTKPVSTPRFGLAKRRPASDAERRFSARVSLPRED